MKCDTCKFRTGYTLASDEVGAGNYFGYCTKQHWEGDDRPYWERNEITPDPWVDCKDFQEDPNRTSKDDR